ncbi:MAG TPA: outer membrane beta-barrel protein [Dyella sp.]|uniref:outer membrane beta-barrel protein n=1 Tax=Dyella sp. TaxID=1869338 RepID=UPI002D771701|nr:outer membrane beta-barrel protein [Dyella sp.]HET6554404.1 outer membrane beta-barrel protein [Dyella sp.]
MAVRTILARSIVLALAACSGEVYASQFVYSIYLTGEHSDNATLVTSNPVSTNVLVPGATFTYTEQGSTVQANVNGNVEYRAYSGNTFDNQSVVDLNGMVNWAMIPQRLDFTVQDFAGVAPVNPLAANTPDNQQQTNVLALGPVLHFRVGEGMSGDAELHYINSYASKVDQFNSSRGQAALRLYRDLSATDQLSGNVEYQHVDFNNSAAGSNYDNYAAYLRYTSRLTKLSVDADLGWSRIDFTDGGSHDSPLVRLILGWSLTPRSTITVNGVYQYADATQDMLGPTNVPLGGELVPLEPLPQTIDQTLGTIGVGKVVIDSDVYKESQIAGTYSYRDERVNFSVVPSYSKLNYINTTTLDQVNKGLGLTLDYKVTQKVSITGFASGERVTYDNIDRHDKNYGFGLGFNHEFTPHWSWGGSYARHIQHSDAVGQSYHENEYFLTLVYKR